MGRPDAISRPEPRDSPGWIKREIQRRDMNGGSAQDIQSPIDTLSLATTHLAVLLDLECCEGDSDPEPSLDAEHAHEALVEDEDPLRRRGEEGCRVVEGGDRTRVDGRRRQRREQMRWRKEVEGLQAKNYDITRISISVADMADIVRRK